MLDFFAVFKLSFRERQFIRKVGKVIRRPDGILELWGRLLEHPNDILEEVPIILELRTFIRTFPRILELPRNILENHKKTEQLPPIRKLLSQSFRIILHNTIVNRLRENLDIFVRYKLFSICIVSDET